MEAFEKWIDKRGEICCSQCAEAAWKAALEWVLSEIDQRDLKRTTIIVKMREELEASDVPS